MPVYADCDYCGEKNLIGHLKYFRFCEKKFCVVCHLKHKLPHMLPEIEDYMDRPVNLEEAFDTPEYIQMPMTVPHDIPMSDDSIRIPAIRTIEPDLESNVRIRNFDEAIEKDDIEPMTPITLDKKPEPEPADLMDDFIPEEEEQVESSIICPKCRSKMIIEIQSEFEVDETEENTGLIPAYECHDCGHIWPILPKEEQVESPKKEEENVFSNPEAVKAAKRLLKELGDDDTYNQLVVTAFDYTKVDYQFRKIIPGIGIEEIRLAARAAEAYIRNFSPNVDFVVIAKMKRSDD